MKKNLLATLLVAILASSMVFAGIGGEASVGFGGNLDNGNFGFLSQYSGVTLDIDLATDSGEAKGEGAVYASIKGSMSLTYLGDFGSYNYKSSEDLTFGVNASISEAKVAGENWSVSILGAPKGLDYAKSAIDTYPVAAEDNWGRDLGYNVYKPYTFAAPYAKVAGVTVNVFDYKFGFGLLGDYNKDNTKVNFATLVETPEYNFGGITAQVGATYAYNEFEKLNSGVPTSSATYNATNAMGVSAKAGYANDAFSANVATDMGVNFLAADNKFNADFAANFKYDFLTADFYFATYVQNIKNLGSAQVGLDLNSFNVPVALTFAAKDLVNKQALSVNAVVTAIENLKLTANGGYTIKTKGWKAGLSAEYAPEMFTAKASVGVSVQQKNAPVILSASASIANETLIPGAALKLAWSGAADLLDKDTSKANYGKILATCTIGF